MPRRSILSSSTCGLFFLHRSIRTHRLRRPRSPRFFPYYFFSFPSSSLHARRKMQRVWKEYVYTHIPRERRRGGGGERSFLLSYFRITQFFAGTAAPVFSWRHARELSASETAELAQDAALHSCPKRRRHTPPPASMCVSMCVSARVRLSPCGVYVCVRCVSVCAARAVTRTR